MSQINTLYSGSITYFNIILTVFVTNKQMITFIFSILQNVPITVSLRITYFLLIE